MKQVLAKCWSVVMDNRRNPLRHLEVAAEHYFMQLLGWTWSMVVSLSFLSIFSFGLVWMAHLLVFGGMAFTVAVFREGERRMSAAEMASRDLSNSSRCVWKVDSEAC